MNRGALADPALDAAKLVDLIDEQSAAEAAVLRVQCEDHVRRIEAEADAEVRRIGAGARAQGEERGRRQGAKRVAAAETEAQRHSLWARETLIQAAIAQARARAEQLAAGSEASRILTDLIREGLQPLPAGPVRVRLPPGCAGLVDEASGQIADGLWVLRFVYDGATGGGVIVETEDGRVRFDNSIAARIRRRRDPLRRAVADILCADDGSATGG
jgi:V/A-type H+/Na+-transporting ATPase subunit E